ncbi:MAG: hypothetical protein FVQ77_06690 [Cytophagales bacterium]|nr:hypothetical protein [Cytophagales bacterium]
MSDYTPTVEDNLLGIFDKAKLNEEEAKGIIRAEQYILDLDADIKTSVSIILKVHQTAFSHLYDWAGKLRIINIVVGQHQPPHYSKVPNLMYQYTDELNYRISRIRGQEDLIKCLAYTHHRMVFIHPFNNGNGRTARLITDLIAKQQGYQNIKLYHREGEKREEYLQAIRKADQYDYSLLEKKIREQIIPLE